MSLNYDLTKIKNYKTYCWKEATQKECGHGGMTSAYYEDEKTGKFFMLNPITGALVWYMMVLQLDGITKGNVQEAFRRCCLLGELGEFPLRKRVVGTKKFIDDTFTLEDLKLHIGLEVNVCTKTARQFDSLRLKRVKEDAEREFHKAHDKAKVASEILTAPVPV